MSQYENKWYSPFLKQPPILPTPPFSWEKSEISPGGFPAMKTGKVSYFYYNVKLLLQQVGINIRVYCSFNKKRLKQ